MSKRPQEQHLPGIGRLVTTNTVDSRAREFLLLKDRVTVGSDEASDFIIRDETISRRHAILTFQAGRLEVKDLGSTNGTFLNGKRIIGISAFDKGDRIRFGTADFVFLRNASPASIGQIRGDSRSLAPAAKRRRSVRKRIGDRTRLASIDGSDPRDFWLAKRKVSIGSAPQNSLVLSHATISQRHAKLRRRFGKYSLIDLGSTNGTFVNGKRLTSRQRLVRGDELRFGSARFVFLQSPTSRDLKWLSPRTSIALLLLIFLAGLAATENYIIRSSSQGKTSVISDSKSMFQSNTSTKIQPSIPAKSVPSEHSAPHPTSIHTIVTAPEWLRRLNYWRAMAGVPPIAEDTNAAAGAAAHARYMVKNYLARNPETPHHEEPGNPWFTDEGAKAAPKADEVGPGPRESSSVSIDMWIDGALHRLTLLERGLRAATYGHYCEGNVCAGTLVLDSQAQTDNDPLWFGELPDPVMFPANATTIPSNLSVLIVGEWPEPLSLSCSGYTRPAGYPITLQFDQRFVPKLLSYALTRNGSPVDACGYDSITYENSEKATQNWAREGLKDRGAIVLIPREPLQRGAAYAITVMVEAQSDPFDWGQSSPFTGQTRKYDWSFSVSP